MTGCNTGRNIQKYKGAGASTLQDALENGNTASLDIVLQSPAVFVGDGSGLTNIPGVGGSVGNLQQVTDVNATTTRFITLSNTVTSLQTSGNIVVGTNVHAVEYFGDGRHLTSVALETDLISNVSRIGVLETDLSSNSTRIGTVSTDLSSNAGRITTVETDLASNSTRIGTVITDLASNSTRIETVSTDLASNSTRIGTVSTDLADNSTRISTVSTDLASNSTRIETVSTDLASNSTRIGTVSTDLADNSTRISTVSTDLASNAGRITTVETDLASNTGRITTVETDLASNAGRITTVETDLASNSTRIETVSTDLASNSTRIGTITTDLISNSTRIGTITTDLVSNSTRIGTVSTDLASNVVRIGVLESEVQPVNRGGTNITSYGTGDMLFAGTPSALSKLTPGTSGYFLQTNGTGNAPTWENVADIGSATPANLYTDDFITGGPWSGITDANIRVLGNVSNLSNQLVARDDKGDIFVSNVNAIRIYGDGTFLTGVALSTDLADNSTRISTVSTDLASNAGRITTVETDLASNAGRITTVETDLASNAGRITTVETDLADNSTRINTVSTDLADNSTRISTVSTDLADNSTRISTVSTDLADNSTRISTVSTDLADNSTRISTVSTDLADNSTRISTVSTDLADNSTRISTVSTDLASNSTRITNLQNSTIISNSSGITDAFETGDLIYASGQNTLSNLSIGSTSQVLTVSGSGIPVWAAASGGGGGGYWTQSGTYIYYNSGNVGIGTTATSGYKLDVTGSVRGTSFSGSGSGLTGLSTSQISSGTLAVARGGTNISSYGSGEILYSSGGSLTKLGIGTSGEVLTVAGGNPTWAAASGGGSSPWTTSGSNIYYNSGNVGIGTSSPGTPLEIRSSGSANPFDNGLLVYNTNESSNQDSIITLRVGASSAGDPFISFDVAGEAGWAFGMDNSDSNKLKWSTSASNLTTTKMTLTDDGKLGIGTTSPGYKLDVNGTMHIANALYVGSPSPSAGTNGQVLTSTGGGAMAWTTPSSGGSSPWTTSGSDVYRSSGNVGIGTSSPAYPLDVNGTVNATSFRGDGTNLSNITAGSITAEASSTISISTIQVQGGIWDVRTP